MNGIGSREIAGDENINESIKQRIGKEKELNTLMQIS
jgi:hypothetical protein